MKAQTPIGSLIEAGQNILIGFAIQTAANFFVLPLFGMRPSFSDLLGIGLIMTVISIVRSYIIRRWHEFKRMRNVPPDFAHIIEDIAEERRRQIDREGFNLAHDDEHTDRSLAAAAAAYAYAASKDESARKAIKRLDDVLVRKAWPATWGIGWFKPTRPRRDLIKAAALIVAEIGRLDRAAKRRA